MIYHRIPDSGSMCVTTVSATAGLAGFGRLVQRIWSRWPATTTESARFRLYIAVLYWNALTVLPEGRRLAEDYFQCCVADLAAAWQGDEPENDLPARIITTIEDGSRADTAA